MPVSFVGTKTCEVSFSLLPCSSNPAAAARCRLKLLPILGSGRAPN